MPEWQSIPSLATTYVDNYDRLDEVVQLGFIVSLPRSGSTVLSSLLDRQLGLVCPPESVFPQLLSVLNDEELGDPDYLAALFVASCFSGSALNRQEAVSCMTGSALQMLIALGQAIAQKSGRDPELVKAVIWKSTRMLSFSSVPNNCGNLLLKLRRNPQNVYESQFRVPFGIHNRNPLYFALFAQSYEQAMATYHNVPVMDLEYPQIPYCVPKVAAALGAGDELWQTGQSALEGSVSQLDWHAKILEAFHNNDSEKRARLNILRRLALKSLILMTRPLRPCLGGVRRKYDLAVARQVIEQAKTTGYG